MKHLVTRRELVESKKVSPVIAAAKPRWEPEAKNLPKR
jgi:hypothetical protein